MTGSVDLFDAWGTHLRTCPRGAMEALDRVRASLPSCADAWLVPDQHTIFVRFPRSDKLYSYSVWATARQPAPRTLQVERW